ncbi:6,7-dimethyl-8-ribityllumazine synthase [bacterium]|nr:6,7-dimethyl-8-ribityllumazine synthase [bacterium]
MRRHDTSRDGSRLRVGVAVSRFNSVVTERLLAGALAALAQHGVADAAIEVAHVSGAFELPLLADLYARSRRVDAIVALGAVVRGETPHFDMIATWVVAELGRLGTAYHLPIALGVLTTDTLEQALERAGGAHGNKGAEAAVVAIEMANLARDFA